MRLSDNPAQWEALRNQALSGRNRAMKVGFIGLGRMGTGMAASLLRAGHALTVFNRRPGKAGALVAQGAMEAATIADTCGGEAVFTMLANDDAAEAVAFGSDGILD